MLAIRSFRELSRHILYMYIKVKLALCFLTKHHAMEAYWRSRGIAPCILDLGIRWR
jgi:hypothetical protein